MTRLQDIGGPTVFRLPPGPTGAGVTGSRRLVFRTDLRSLDGMQKEAIVTRLEPAGRAWRMASDEGPYLNGTDLAPFPLAFFAVGLQFSLVAEIVRHAATAGIPVRRVDTVQETRYSMTGSALRGDMQGEAFPVEVLVRLEGPIDREAAAELIESAERTSPAHALMRDPLANRFALTLNGERVPLEGLLPVPEPGGEDPRSCFDNLKADPTPGIPTDLVTKRAEAERVHGEGGVASSLQAEQRRILHIHAESQWEAGALVESVVRLIRPIGSSFRFLCDASVADDRTPSPLAYLSAGTAFCFLTQLGRYAHITKQRVHATRIAQETVFLNAAPPAAGPAAAGAAPVATHVFVEADESPEAIVRAVRMGEQTCFLHAAMRGPHQTALQGELNGEPVSLGAGVTPKAR